jgi:hypothetical protein
MSIARFNDRVGKIYFVRMALNRDHHLSRVLLRIIGRKIVCGEMVQVGRVWCEERAYRV